jgi:hypothetical protein
MNKLWVGFSVVSVLGLAMTLLSASAATVPIWGLLFGPIIFSVGWLLVSGVVWFALMSAVSFHVSKYPASTGRLSLVAALALGSGVQSVMFLMPNASASLTWEPESAVLVTLIQLFIVAGVVLVATGVLLTLTAAIRRTKGVASN